MTFACKDITRLPRLVHCYFCQAWCFILIYMFYIRIFLKKCKERKIIFCYKYEITLREKRKKLFLGWFKHPCIYFFLNFYTLIAENWFSSFAGKVGRRLEHTKWYYVEKREIFKIWLFLIMHFKGDGLNIYFWCSRCN